MFRIVWFIVGCIYGPDSFFRLMQRFLAATKYLWQLLEQRFQEGCCRVAKQLTGAQMLNRWHIQPSIHPRRNIKRARATRVAAIDVVPSSIPLPLGLPAPCHKPLALWLQSSSIFVQFACTIVLVDVVAVFHTVPCRTVQYRTVNYCTVLYCTLKIRAYVVLYCNVQYSRYGE